MSVGKSYSKRLGVADFLIKSAAIDIVIAYTLHLSEF